jgi:hypothetical protein
MTGSYPDYIDPGLGLGIMAVMAVIIWVQKSPERRAARKARLNK